MRRLRLEFGAVGAGQSGHVAGIFDDRNLHSEADAEVRDRAFTGIAHRTDLAFNAALPETAGHENGIHIRQQGTGVVADILGITVANVYLGARLDPRVGQGFGQRLVSLGVVGVFADHGDIHLAIEVGQPIDHVPPFREIGGGRLQVQLAHHDVVQPLLMQQQRNPVNGVGVHRGDDGLFADIGE